MPPKPGISVTGKVIAIETSEDDPRVFHSGTYRPLG